MRFTTRESKTVDMWTVISQDMFTAASMTFLLRNIEKNFDFTWQVRDRRMVL
jgi:hypothetical protein